MAKRIIYTEDRQTFEHMLLVGNLKQPHTVRMVDRAAKFVGGMPNESGTRFLEAAVDFAWENRNSFNLQYESLEMFWTRCLEAAALTRDKWLVSVATLPGVFESRWVLGRRLVDMARSKI
jgi:hypothetical protein